MLLVTCPSSQFISMQSGHTSPPYSYLILILVILEKKTSFWEWTFMLIHCCMASGVDSLALQSPLRQDLDRFWLEAPQTHVHLLTIVLHPFMLPLSLVTSFFASFGKWKKVPQTAIISILTNVLLYISMKITLMPTMGVPLCHCQNKTSWRV